MTKKHYRYLFLLGLVVASLTAYLEKAPGYMDADYYFAGGLQLAQGGGFTEMLIWNYLDDPEGLPHPAFTYWMPLASVIAFVGIKLLPFIESFRAAQVGFVLITAAVPVVTARLGFVLSGESKHGILAGILAVFSGFYLPNAVTTDSFGLAMLLGGAFFLAVIRLENKWQPVWLGILAGLMHMARADGLLWLAVGLAAVWLSRSADPPRILAGRFLGLFGGYLLVASPWLLRNISLYGSVLPPGGGQTLWFLSYDELFSYPAGLLTFERWWASGLAEIVKVRLSSLEANFYTAAVVQGMIFLGPLALAGAWLKRKMVAIKIGWLAWGAIFFAMTFAFPFSGARGGYLHSGAAFMPLLWGLAPLGLDSFVGWGARRRGWKKHEAWGFFQSGLVMLVVGMSAFLVYQFVIGPNPAQPVWDTGERSYVELEKRLLVLGAEPDDVVMVNNPPGYYAANRRPVVVMPNGDIDTLLAVAARYQPDYVLLEFNHGLGLNELYASPRDLPGLRYLETYNQTHIFIREESSP